MSASGLPLPPAIPEYLKDKVDCFKDIPGDVIRKICRFSSVNASEIINLQKINKQFYDQLSYNQPLMNTIWENITRNNFGKQIPKKLKAKKWNNLYKHYHAKIDLNKDEIEIASTQNEGLPNGFEWEFPCNLEFEDMKSTNCNTVRFCSKCSKHVYEIDIDDKQTLNDKINMGVCVAITNRKGYEINGKWYESKPLKQSKRPHTKSRWVYNGRDWIRV